MGFKFQLPVIHPAIFVIATLVVVVFSLAIESIQLNRIETNLGYLLNVTQSQAIKASVAVKAEVTPEPTPEATPAGKKSGPSKVASSPKVTAKE